MLQLARIGMGVMPRYVKTPVSVTDAEVLSKHPYVAMWKQMVQFIPYLPHYDSVCNLFKLHTRNTTLKALHEQLLKDKPYLRKGNA